MSPSSSPSSQRRVLVVDDEPSVLRALQRTLGNASWQVDVAASAEEGLALMQASPAQVVLGDARLPGMDGVELLEQVKGRFPDAQRILLTGTADPQALQEMLNRLAVFRFVIKPWDDAQLRLLVAGAFEQYDLQEENRRLLALTLKQNEELVKLTHSLEAKVHERTALLSRGKREWEATFDSIERPIAILEKDLRVARANLAYAAMARRPIREVIGGKCHELLFGSATPCAACPLGRGEPPGSPVELRRGESSFSMSSYPVVEDGERRVCFYRDTTEERTLARRMAVAEKMAAIGQLAAGVAHEINNPLGGILAFTQLMQRDDGRSANDVETLGDMEHAALRCKRIVEGLLKFSRSEPAARRPIDVNRAVEDAVTLFRPQLKHSPKARLELHLSAAPLVVDGDSDQIEQVVLNLLVNALHALQGGAGTVRVASGTSAGRVRIAVADDGIGILPEHRAHLFEPTFTTKPPGEGTGFGLAISWNIAEAHGGTIEVQSTPGQGSTFTLDLPPANP